MESTQSHKTKHHITNQTASEPTSFKVDFDKEDDVEEPRQTFILPFVVSTFLILPSLLVVAYSKQTVGYDLLVLNGMYSVITAIMSVLISISAVSCLLYVWRGYSHAAKAAVVILEIVAVAGFVYVVWPN